MQTYTFKEAYSNFHYKNKSTIYNTTYNKTFLTEAQFLQGNCQNNNQLSNLTQAFTVVIYTYYFILQIPTLGEWGFVPAVRINVF